MVFSEYSIVCMNSGRFMILFEPLEYTFWRCRRWMASYPKCCSTLKSIWVTFNLRILWRWPYGRCPCHIWRRFATRSRVHWGFSEVFQLRQFWFLTHQRFDCHHGRIVWALGTCALWRSGQTHSQRMQIWGWFFCWRVRLLFRCSFYFKNKIINKLYFGNKGSEFEKVGFSHSI